MSIRLINTSSLRMETFMGESIPNYAILSHTWVDGEEVSYQEMTQIAHDPDHPAMERSGYKKILDTCTKARKHAIQYAWVDTCCIDKSSSAELSEAINSMYKFYQQAEVCYVILSDMTPSMKVRRNLQNCRWFTRGWCLQELLAPADLRFYNNTWEFIGSKSELSRMISNFTEIDRTALDGSTHVHNFAVGQRMSWAAKRQTTRVEDMAYCLLGILDVNMPMLYGEGGKAFLRLQEEVIKQSNDLSIFAFGYVALPLGGRSTKTSRELMPGPLYRNLFATSPRDFADSGQIFRSSNGNAMGQSYVLTNSGLYFRAAELLLNPTLEDYILPLNCSKRGPENPSTGNCYMYLRKIGPSQFVRLSHPVERDTPALFSGSATEEAYIITKVPPSMGKAQGAPSNMRSIQLNLGKSHDRDCAIQDAWPRNQWDASNNKFLIREDEVLFEGYLKVLPSLMNLGHDARDTASFYLVCGVYWTEYRSSRSLEVMGNAWLLLFSAVEWESLERRFGERTLREIIRTRDSRSPKVKLTLQSNLIVTVKLLPHTRDEYNLHIDLEFQNGKGEVLPKTNIQDSEFQYVVYQI